jgi:hypothetical protein
MLEELRYPSADPTVVRGDHAILGLATIVFESGRKAAAVNGPSGRREAGPGDRPKHARAPRTAVLL